MALALSRSSFAKSLTSRPAIFLGRISYSLYLLHATVLFAFVNSLASVSTVVGNPACLRPIRHRVRVGLLDVPGEAEQ